MQKASTTNTIKGARLSALQARLWPLLQDTTLYSAQCTLVLNGLLKQQAFLQAYQQVVSTYEILHTTFRIVRNMDVPMQIIDSRIALECRVIDLKMLDISVSDAQMFEHSKKLQMVEIEPGVGPLLQAFLFCLSTDRHILTLRLPALCADTSSLSILISKLCQTYNAILEGERMDEEPPLQYVDVSSWLNDLVTSSDAFSKKEVWQKMHPGDRSATQLPFARTGERSGTFYTPPPHFQPQSQPISLDPELIQALGVRSEQLGVSVQAYLLACWQVVIWRFTGVQTPLIGMLCDGRSFEELVDAFGLYSRVVPFSQQLEGETLFTQHVQKTFARWQQVVQQQHYFSWEDVGQAAPYYLPISYAYEMCLDQWQVKDGTWQLSTLAGITEPFALRLHVLQMGQHSSIDLQYDPTHLSTQQVQRLGVAFQQVLQASVQQAEIRLDHLPLLEIGGLERLRQLGSGSERNWEKLPWHRQFILWSQRTPQAPAVVSDGVCLSYEQLERQTQCVAQVLRQQKVEANSPVVVCLSRSVGQLVAILGVLRAGGAYVPLEGEQPVARLQSIVQHVQPVVLLTQENWRERFVPWEGCTLTLDEMDVEAIEDEWEEPEVEMDDLAAIIYTSGSTGLPKGVEVTHRGVWNYACGIKERLQVESGWRYGSVTTLAADLGNTMLFTALGTGGCLHLLSYETVTSVPLLQAYVQREQIDVLKTVPSHLSALLPAGGAAILPQRALILGGERLSWELLRQIQACGGACHVYNHYGPTETTVGVLVHCVGQACEWDDDWWKRQQAESESVPLGVPLPAIQVSVRDERGQYVPQGVSGELWIAGAGLARGYWKQPGQTQQHFVERDGQRWYRTGDRMRYTEQQQLEYLGRSDGQIKMRGYRIELAEIEHAFQQVQGVKESIVLARENERDELELVSYVIMDQAGYNTLKQTIRERLPEYMVPSQIVQLKEWPLTHNGKVDRQKLRTQAFDQHFLKEQDDQKIASVQPRDVIEHQLLTIWEDLLSWRPIGVTDSFFDIGGHSILAVSLISLIQQQFDYAMPLTALFQYPTIADLAVLVRRQITLPARKALVPIKPHGEKLPLFCIHPSGGNVFCYSNLARHLEKQRPVYGLQTPELPAGMPPLSTIEEIAAHYIEALRVVQPVGPYLLAGWSLGGIIALEMAQQLHRQGHAIGMLAIIDSTLLDSEQRKAATSVLDLSDTHLASMVLQHFHINVDEEIVAPLSTTEQLVYALEEGKRLHLIPHDTTLEQLRFFTGMHEINTHAVKQYEPVLYPCSIDLFLSEGSLADEMKAMQEVTSEEAMRHHTQAWANIAGGGLHRYLVPGKHHEIVEEPYVKLLVDQINLALAALMPH